MKNECDSSSGNTITYYPLMKLWLAGIVKRLSFFGAKSSAETEIEIQVNVRPYYSM